MISLLPGLLLALAPVEAAVGSEKKLTVLELRKAVQRFRISLRTLVEDAAHGV